MEENKTTKPQGARRVTKRIIYTTTKDTEGHKENYLYKTTKGTEGKKRLFIWNHWRAGALMVLQRIENTLVKSLICDELKTVYKICGIGRFMWLIIITTIVKDTISQAKACATVEWLYGLYPLLLIFATLSDI